MRKYVSPNVAIGMGIFMLIASVIYTMVITHVLVLNQMDGQLKLILSIPAMGLVIYGLGCIIWSLIMSDKLRYSPEADAWVLK